MGQLLSADVATNLYWLGRYVARIEVMLLQIIVAYDKIIDVDRDAGVELYRKIGVNLEYSNAMDFFHQAIFGDHVANLSGTMEYARENAIIARNYINIDAFGEIISLSKLLREASSGNGRIDYTLIDTLMSLISEIWGQLLKVKLRRKSDYFIRLGKLVEETDFHFRFRGDRTLAITVVNEINSILRILSDGKEMDFLENEKWYDENENIMDAIHNKIEEIIVY